MYAREWKWVSFQLIYPDSWHTHGTQGTLRWAGC